MCNEQTRDNGMCCVHEKHTRFLVKKQFFVPFPGSYAGSLMQTSRGRVREMYWMKIVCASMKVQARNFAMKSCVPVPIALAHTSLSYQKPNELLMVFGHENKHISL